MARNYFFLFVFLCSFSNLTAASELPACFSYSYSIELNDADELRSVAATCPIDSLSNLYANRAYHQELVIMNVPHQGVQRLGSDDLGRALDSYRLYIALIEVFAPRVNADIAATVAAMNRGYEHAAEVFELRFLGYGQRANWIENMRSLSTAKPK